MKNFTSKMTRALVAEKKHFSFLLVALSCLFMILLPFSEAKAWTVKDGVYYSADGKMINTMIGYSNEELSYYYVRWDKPTSSSNYNYLSGNVYIKEKLYGKNVEKIGAEAFHNMSGYVNIICPSTLKTIGDQAFYHADGLLMIQMNEGLTELGSFAFAGCTNLTAVLVPKTLVSIKGHTFQGCTLLPGISLPGVKIIEEYAFAGCTALEEVSGGLGSPSCPVQKIEEYAFKDCANLKKVNFPNLQSIGERAFVNCTNLKTLTLPSSLVSIGNFAFQNSGLKILTNNNTTPQPIKANVFDGVDLSKCILYVPKGYKGAYKAADVWKEFGNILEPGEEPVDLQAQQDPEEEIPEEEQVKPIYVGLQKIGSLHYMLNEDLTARVVFYVDNLKLSGKIEIPKSVKYEGYEYTVTAIGDEAFKQCDNITEVVLPSTIVSIGERSFNYMQGLKAINFPPSLKEIGNRAFRSCTHLESVSLPPTIKKLNTATFLGCHNIASLSLPAALDTICDSCFISCHKLTSIKLPGTLKMIGKSAFAYCEGVRSIILPSSITYIGEGAFSKSGLTTITTKAEAPAVIHENAFAGLGREVNNPKVGWISLDIVLYVPNGTVADYEKATGWKRIYNIKELGSTDKIKYGKLYYQLKEDKTAYVTYEKNEAGNYSDLSGEITIPKTIEYKGLEYEVTEIGQNAFRYATGITKVNLPEVLDEIRSMAFNGCTKLAEINIPATLTWLDDDAFGGNTKLFVDNKDKDGAVYYDNCLLALTKKLSGDYTVKEGTRLIASNAFLDQDELTSLTLPEGLQVLCTSALSDMLKLKTVTLPSTLQYIGGGFLHNCYVLSTIYNYAEKPYNLSDTYCFDGMDQSKCTLYVPKGSKKYYESAVEWKNFPILEMDPVYFTVTYVDWNGDVLYSEEVEKGGYVYPPFDPEREGYTFLEWDDEIYKAEDVQEDVTVTALYEVNKYTVKFLDWDESTIDDTQIIEYGESAVAPADPERAGYNFIGWDKDFSVVKGNLYVHAQYAEKVWTVTYLNWDDELLGTEQVKDGEDAKGMVATKVGWYFDYWYNTKNFEEVDLKNITKDLTVKAQFTYEVTFSVTYLVNGVKTFEIEAVYGFDVSKIYYNPKDAPKVPERESDAMYDYTFVGWTPEVEYLLNNVVLEAVFEATPRKYTVSFYNWDDQLIEEKEVEYGLAAEAPADPTREGYTFTGWDKDFYDITGDLTVKAQYKINTYSVIFVDWDDVVLRSAQIVNYGADAVPPADPVRTGYTFTGWDVEYKNVTSDLTVKATYEINKYTVRFFGQDGKTQIGENQTINWNEAATAPEEKDIPAVEGYHFTGWDTEFDHVKADLDIKAVYEINKYTVTFVDYDGETVLKSEEVEHGAAATAPADPTREGYNFTGWDKAFDAVTEDLTVTAQYEVAVVYFTVTYYDWDLTVLGTEKVEEGKDAKGLEPEPTREGYTFTGWSKPLENITSDLSVQALYEVAKVYFTVTYYDWDLTVLGTEKVEEGKDAKGIEPEPTRDGYTFTGWSKPLENITSDLSVQALYEEIVEADYTPKNLKAVLTPQENDDVLITLSWDKVNGAISYELRVTANDKELFSQNTMTLNVIASKLSDIEKDYKLTPGTYTINWFVRSTDVMGTAVSDWAQGESFEVTVKDTGTGVDNVQSDNVQSTKVMENGVLYIMYNGTKYNVQGKMVK